MKRSTKINAILATAVLTFAPFARAESAPPAAKINFQDHVLPIFRNACLNCHNADKKKAGLDISTHGATIAGSDGQKVVVPGDPDASFLYKVIIHAEEPKMPQRADKLPAKDLEIIKQWIAQGALENSGSKAAAVAKPKLALTIDPADTGKPTGPVAVPKGLSIEPVVHTKRSGEVSALSCSPWAPVVALAGQKQVVLYDTEKLELLGILPFPEGFPRVIEFSRNGNMLLVGGGQGAKLGKVVLHDVATGKRVAELGDEFDEVLAADVSPDLSRVALGGPSRMLKILATADGQVLHSIKKHTDWVTAVAFSPDGQYLASADRAGNLVVWDDGGQELYALNGHKGAVTDVAFRGDSKVLASASQDGTVKLWDMEEGKQLKTWNAHGGGVLSVGFAHDGRLVSSGRDKLAKTWNGDGSALKQMEAMPDIALRAAFDHEGKRVLAGDWSGQVRVYTAADGKRAGELTVNPPTTAERIADLDRKLKELEPARQKADAEHAAAKQAVEKAEAEAKKLRQSAADKRKAVEAAKARLKEATDALARATADAAAAKKAAEAKPGELKPLLDKAAKAKQAADESTKNVEALKAELSRLQSVKLQASAQ